MSGLKDFIVKNVTWVAQACVIFKFDGKVVYIDPLKVTGPKADVILVTHSHYDHYSADDCKKIATSKTVFVTPNDCVDKITKDFGDNKVIGVKATDQLTVEGISVKTVPAYNPNKKYHPKKNGWVGFIIELGGYKFYHAGDTNRIPEMKGLGVDCSMLPLGQTYTMDTIEEAVEAAKDTGCKIAIPIHFGMYEGKPEDAVTFSKECKKIGIEVMILKSEFEG